MFILDPRVFIFFFLIKVSNLIMKLLFPFETFIQLFISVILVSNRGEK